MGQWYYYSGATVTPIPVAPGRTVAVRPHSKVEIEAITPAVQQLIGAGRLVRTGWPQRAAQAAPVAAGAPADAAALAALPLPGSARFVADRGVTARADQPPAAAPSITPGLTEPERMEQQGAKADAGAEGAAEGKQRKQRRR